jgi:hypothetical protein
MHFLTAAQVEQLAAVIAAPYPLLVRFDADTGLRAGELAALRVGRLDLLRGACEVVESATEEHRGRAAPPGQQVGVDYLDRYGHLFPEELDHLADRLDRLHAEASVYRRPGGRPSGKAKGLVGDQALLVEVGRLELPGLVIRQRVREGWFEAGCGPVVAPPWPRGPIRSSSVRNRRSRATSHATAINRSLLAMGSMVRRPRRVGNPDPRFGHRSRDRPGRRDLLVPGRPGTLADLDRRGGPRTPIPRPRLPPTGWGRLGLDPAPAPALQLLGGIWSPPADLRLATARTQARAERRAAGRVCPICRDNDAA